MKKRIEQLLNGQFSKHTENLVRVPERLELYAKPGQTIKGSFRLSSSSGRRIRGFLFCSDSRMHLETEEFHAADIQVRYRMEIPDIFEEKQLTGEITVCSEVGEYTLPYVVYQKEPQKSPSDSSLTIPELAAVAEKDFSKAYGIFISDDFGKSLSVRDPEMYALYAALENGERSFENLENFLSAAGVKQPVSVFASIPDVPVSYDARKNLAEQSVLFDQMTGPVREEISLSQENWGFAKLRIRSDAAFLIPQKHVITTDDFVGKNYQAEYVIDTSRMHPGMNFGRIRISCGPEQYVLEVSARRAALRPEDEKEKQDRLICRKMKAHLENLYIAFRLNRIRRREWVDQSLEVIRKYREAGGRNPYADLFCLQMYYADGQQKKALDILSYYRENKNLLTRTDQYAFYRYLTTFFHEDDNYVDEIEGEIRLLFMQEPSNWILQWILLYLQEDLMNDLHAKYEAVRGQYEKGCRSRIMYLEAWQIICQDPLILTGLDAFECSILRFALEEHVMTAETAAQVSGLGIYGKPFNRIIEAVLEEGYRLEPSRELLKSICTYLMRGEQKSPEAYYWYAKGVENGLRITGLYEYFLSSLPAAEYEELPQVIRMFFLYDDTLEYTKRADIFYQIWLNRESYPQTWRMHQPALSRFVQEQLEQGHITEHLSVLYREMLHRDMLSRLMQEQLLRLVFSWKITCTMERVQYAIVHSAMRMEEQRIPFIQGEAVVRKYDDVSWIMLELDDGSRIPASQVASAVRLLPDEKLLSWCIEMRPHETGVLQYVSDQCLRQTKQEEKWIPYIMEAAQREDFSEVYRLKIRKLVLGYFMEHPLDDSLPDYLRNIPLNSFAGADETSLITLLAEEGMCEQAFHLLERYGSGRIPLLKLVRICSRMIIATEFDENRTLTDLCYTCFDGGKYDDKLLRYLLLYYEGPVREMIAVWRAGMEFELDTMLMEEKILSLLLFVQEYVEGTEDVFASYLNKMGRKKICEAYVNLKCYEYFVKGLPVGRPVFSFLESEYLQDKNIDHSFEQPLVRSLALLQYESNRHSLSPEIRDMVSRLLEECDEQDLRFSFWNKFDRDLLAPYQMEGRVFVEYAGDPASEVFIHYRRVPAGHTEEKNDTAQVRRTEILQNRFEGIFVREFVLFPDEELICELEERQDEEVLRREEYHLKSSGEPSGRTNDRYELLGGMSEACAAGDKKALKEHLETYYTQRYLAKELFTFV